MAELTTEYLDKKFSEQTAALKSYVEERTASLATKQDVRDAADELARMVNAGFEEVYSRLDVREQVGQHSRDIQEIKRALKLA
jgi:hypothetical protein